MQSKDSIQSEVYRFYYNKVFGYVLNRVHSRADAEDISSDVFLKVFLKSDEFDLHRSGASTYIFRVMQTTLADFFRKNRIVYTSLEEVSDEIDETENLDELLTFLDDALDTLTERELAIVILHYYHGLSHKEVAKKMQLSYVNVRQICHVALEKLRKEMEK